MKQLYHLVEVFIQIVLVEHEDRLAQCQGSEGTVQTQDTGTTKV
jgi:hypothetical protein